MLRPDFDSWVPSQSYFGGSYITSQLDWTAWLILCDHEMQRCVEDISWLCILIQDKLSTHLLHCTLYSAWQTSSLVSSKTIPQFTWSWMSTWNQFRPLCSSSSSKSSPLKKKTTCVWGVQKKLANKFGCRSSLHEVMNWQFLVQFLFLFFRANSWLWAHFYW